MGNSHRSEPGLVSNSVQLEVCVDSVESAVAAFRGGAHRVELCSNLVEGGTTPSVGLIATVREKIPIELYVIIRPRGGDFCYNAEELQIMRHDVITAKNMGVEGVTLGVLQTDGRVDFDRTQSLLNLALPLRVTFHRAFDMSRNLDEALEDVISIGIDRVLTSGGEQNAEEGILALARLVSAAAGRIAIMPGGGITEANVRHIVVATGVREIHASARTAVPSQMQYRNEKVSMGVLPQREYQRHIVLQENVRRLLEAAGSGEMDEDWRLKNLSPPVRQ